MMTQHTKAVSSKHNLKGPFPSSGPRESIRRAKERAQLDLGNWEQLKWYVNFTKLDLSDLSDGDLLNIQDEVAALCWIAEGELMERPLLPLKNLQVIHQDFSTQLGNLVDHHRADFGSFSYTVVVHRLQEILINRPGVNPEDYEDVPKVNISKKFSHCKTQESMITTILKNHLIELLGEFGQSLFRCLKCKQLFLQLRSHAKCCSRECQRRRAMEVIRQKKKTEDVKAKPLQKTRQGSARKRRT